MNSWGRNSASNSEGWGGSSSPTIIGSSSSEGFAQSGGRAPSSGNPNSVWDSTGAKGMQGANSAMWQQQQQGSEPGSKSDGAAKWGTGVTDSDPWGRNSTTAGGGGGSYSNSSWTGVGEKKDISGWGSLNPSPVPNAGTESWGGGPQQQENRSNSEWKQQDNRSNNGFIPPESRQTSSSSSWGADPTAKQQPQPSQSSWGPGNTGGGGGATGAWSRGNPIAPPSQQQATTNAAANQQQQQQPPPQQPSSWAEAVTSKLGTGGSSGSTSVTDDPKVVARKTQEEFIAQAINSNEGWGKTAIRQDTAWVIDEPVPSEPQKPELESTESTVPSSKQVMTGTGIWESLKSTGGAAKVVPTDDRSAAPWGSSGVLEKPVTVVNGPNPALAVGSNPQSAFRPPLDKPPPINWPMGSAGGAEKSASGWGGGSTSSEGSWDGSAKKKKVPTATLR